MILLELKKGQEGENGKRKKLIEEYRQIRLTCLKKKGSRTVFMLTTTRYITLYHIKSYPARM